MSDHAILSASGAHIWMNCAHAGRAQLNFPDMPSVFSREGTFAHTYAETMLRCLLAVDAKQMTTAAMSAELVALEQSENGKEFFNADFQEHVESYVRRCLITIQSARRSTPDALVLLEQRLEFSRWVPEGFGTGDLVVVANGTLQVRDLKFGKGVEVDATDNEQLDLYALGAIDTFLGLYDFDKVSVEIDQPRRGHIDSAPERSVTELIKWGDEVVRPRAELAWAGTGPATAGDWCRFCRARHTCRVRYEANIGVRGADPNQLTDEEVVAVLPKLDQAIKWATDLKDWAQERAVKGEKTWPGWKLVAGRSNRVITDKTALLGLLVDNGIDATVVTEAPSTERPLLGLTELEKTVGKKLFGEIIEGTGLVVKPAGAPTLVPESDKREAWSSNVSTADDDFNDNSEPQGADKDFA